MAQCNRCGDRIMFVVTEAKGRRMPLDPTPSGDGNVILVDGPDGVKLARVLPKDELEKPAEQSRYTSHMWTCPQRGPR